MLSNTNPSLLSSNIFYSEVGLKNHSGIETLKLKVPVLILIIIFKFFDFSTKCGTMSRSAGTLRQ